jgi:hypothetical protein
LADVLSPGEPLSAGHDQNEQFGVISTARIPTARRVHPIGHSNVLEVHLELLKNIYNIFIYFLIFIGPVPSD